MCSRLTTFLLTLHTLSYVKQQYLTSCPNICPELNHSPYLIGFEDLGCNTFWNSLAIEGDYTQQGVDI
ncbi:hypothetical protein GDO78_012629 [Eleutherodactylus coqui]|uniref:Uncharacterized protein n=1 Tax=Eleutherodactylus coqui TaxID=57060 RepID=A0A8J6K312_ELECQ|nr:hypothetical protein GDO78_012629 [Eleutherodactylus coqui]